MLHEVRRADHCCPRFLGLTYFPLPHSLPFCWEVWARFSVGARHVWVRFTCAKELWLWLCCCDAIVKICGGGTDRVAASGVVRLEFEHSHPSPLCSLFSCFFSHGKVGGDSQHTILPVVGVSRGCCSRLPTSSLCSPLEHFPPKSSSRYSLWHSLRDRDL